MKCGYGQNCKYGEEVDKCTGVKVGNKYYHNECYHEKEMKVKVESFYIDNFPQTTLPVLRKVIKQFLSKNEIDYLYHIVRYIKDNNKPINSPFALLNYCNDYRIINSYNDLKISKEYKDVKNRIENNIDKDTTIFTYKINNKKITDII